MLKLELHATVYCIYPRKLYKCLSLQNVYLLNILNWLLHFIEDFIRSVAQACSTTCSTPGERVGHIKVTEVLLVSFRTFVVSLRVYNFKMPAFVAITVPF